MLNMKFLPSISYLNPSVTQCITSVSHLISLSLILLPSVKSSLSSLVALSVIRKKQCVAEGPVRCSGLSSDTVRDLWLIHSASWGGVRGQGATLCVFGVSLPEYLPWDKSGLHPEVKC